MDLIHGSGAQSPPPAFSSQYLPAPWKSSLCGYRLIVLRCKGRRFVFQHLHGFHTQLGADCRQLVKQTSTCLIFCNAHLFLAMISPVSSPTSMRIIVTPVISSPLMTAHWIGAAPRYFGSRDACTLMHPYFGRSRILFGRICPKAATMMISGANFFKYSTLASSRIFTGWNTSSPWETAHSFTGGNCMVFPRPFGLSGCVTTSITSCPASMIFSNVFTAKSGVPIKITFHIIPLPAPHNSHHEVRLLLFLYTYVHPDDPVHGKCSVPSDLRLLLPTHSCPDHKILLLHGSDV